MFRLRRVLQPRYRHSDRPDRPVVAAHRPEGGRLNIQIRLATDADLPALANLRREWTHEWYGSSDEPGYGDAFAAWWRSEADRRLMWVASSQATILGMLNLVEFRRMPRPGQPPSGWGYISNVYVRRDCRNQGIGKTLLAAAITEAERRGYDRLVLNPSERSTTLYARAGFAPAVGLFALSLAREA